MKSTVRFNLARDTITVKDVGYKQCLDYTDCSAHNPAAGADVTVTVGL